MAKVSSSSEVELWRWWRLHCWMATHAGWWGTDRRVSASINGVWDWLTQFSSLGVYITGGGYNSARGKEREREGETQRRQITDPRSLNSRSRRRNTRPTCVVEDEDSRTMHRSVFHARWRSHTEVAFRVDGCYLGNSVMCSVTNDCAGSRANTRKKTVFAVFENWGAFLHLSFLTSQIFCYQLFGVSYRKIRKFHVFRINWLNKLRQIELNIINSTTLNLKF